MKCEQKNPRIRFLATFLAVVMLFGILPAVSFAAETTYGVVTTDSTRIRPYPTSDINYGLADKGWVMEIIGTKTVDSVKWYKVIGIAPELNKEVEGYIHSGFFREMSPEEVTAWKAGDTNEDITPDKEHMYIITTSNVGFRTVPDMSAKYSPILDKDTVAYCYAVEGEWFKVDYKGTVGYIKEDYARLLTADEIKGVTVTPPPSESVNPSLPSLPDSSADATATVVTTGGILSLRETASVRADRIKEIPNNTVLDVLSVQRDWTYVTYGGENGYVLTEYLKFNDAPKADRIMTVVTTGGTLTLRKTYRTSAAALAHIPHMTNVNVYSVGDVWSVVYYDHYIGYVLTKYLRDTGYVPEEDGTEYDPDSSTNSSTYANVRTSGGSLNLREKASKASGKLTTIPNNTALKIIERGDDWSKTTYAGLTGFVMNEFLDFTATSGLSDYVFVYRPSTNIRDGIGGKSLTQVAKNTVYPIQGSAQESGSFKWYPVLAKGYYGYVRGDCAFQMTTKQADDYFNHNKYPDPNETPAPSGSDPSDHVISTSKVELNIRAAANTSSTSIAKVKYGTVMEYTGTVSEPNGRVWYKLNYNNISCFVMAKYVRVMTNQEYQEYIGTLPTPTPKPTPVVTAVPDLSKMSDMGYTKIEEVWMRTAPSATGNKIMKIYDAKTYVTLTGKEGKSTSGDINYIWYQVKFNGKTGWIRGDLLYVMTESEKDAYINGTNPSIPTPPTDEYVAYSTLRMGSKGEAVKRMQLALIEQKHLPTGEADGIFGLATKSAVIGFQLANKLNPDGLAGQITLATLYGTPVEKEPYNPSPSNPDFKLYPVEKVDWYKGDIQHVFKKGDRAVLTHVDTGYSFTIRRWAGGKHADVEPYTAEDTAVMCKIYGVSNAQQIADKNLYHRKPVWITLDGRTFAGSIYGVPHNYPEGDTIDDNAYQGQFCVHFVNSRTHSSDRVDEDHQKAIQYAYAHAPTRK